jgi:mannitol-1-/sugar-/sorbitol-6-phosphatase
VGAFHGRPAREVFGTLRDERLAVEALRYFDELELENTHGLVEVPGARRILESLPVDRWVVVTSCSRKLAGVRLRAVGLAIPDSMVTVDDVVEGKPHPEGYCKGLALLEQLQSRTITPSRCLVVEDALSGITAGHDAGARIAALTTTTSVSLLRPALVEGDLLFSDFEDIRSVEIREDSVGIGFEPKNVISYNHQLDI